MCEEDHKVFTFLLTDAQRSGYVPQLCHDSFTVGIYTYNWVYARYEGVHLAAVSLGQGVRRTVDLARWTGIDGGRPDAAAGQQRRYELARRFLRLQFKQHTGVVQRCHINFWHSSLSRTRRCRNTARASSCRGDRRD